MKATSASRLAGIAFVAGAVACFAMMDVATQVITAAVPLLMAMAVRYAMQTTLVGAALLPRRGWALLRTRRPGLQALRGLLMLGCSGTAFLAMSVMPVAEFTAFVLLTPLALTAVTALGDGQRVGLRQWLLVAGGFGGALLIVKPEGLGVGAGLLLPLAIVGVNTGYQWLTSRMAHTEDAGTMQIWAGLTGLVVAGAGLPLAWQPLPARAWLLLLLMAVLAVVGHSLLIQAYRRAPVATLTPFLYLQIGFATLGGWWVFHHRPDALASVGIVIIAACGAAGTWLAARARTQGVTPCTST